jgi:hypothetical protein
MANRYNVAGVTKIDGKQVYKNIKYPEIPLSDNDIYVYTTLGDRLDILAKQFYQDPSLWWIISIANNNFSQNSIIIPPGLQIRIPTNPSEILSKFNLLNN